MIQATEKYRCRTTRKSIKWLLILIFLVSPTIIDEETSTDLTVREGENVTLVCK